MFGRIGRLELPRFSSPLSHLGSLSHRGSARSSSVAAAARDHVEARGPSQSSARSSSVAPVSQLDGVPESSRAPSASSARPERHRGVAGRPPRAKWPPPASAHETSLLPRITVTAHDIKQSQDDACVVCLEELCIGTCATRMPCGHLFHQPCISSWLRKCNQCPVCRYELATDDEEYEQQRIQRKLRIRMADLQVKSVHEIIRLAEHLKVVIVGCYEKRELIRRIAESSLVEIIEVPPDAANLNTKEHLIISKERLAQRLASYNQISSTPSNPAAVGNAHDLAGQIMAELRQTAARLDFQLDECAPNSDANQPRSCFTSVGQTIMRNSAITGGA